MLYQRAVLLLEETLYREGGEALQQVAQRGYGCPIPGSVEGQLRWDPKQPHLPSGIPAHGRGHWNYRVFKGPSNPNL